VFALAEIGAYPPSFTVTLTPNTLLGPYKIVSLLGTGGMGEVYRALDTRLDRTVAIKVLPKHLSEQSSVRERFEREARAISSLTHPHICALYDVGREDGIDYLVMEYLEGESVADLVARGALPTDQVLRYGIEIADALDKAHRQGLVHRDLKPGNIMLTKSGAKLLDFGLVKYTSPEEVGPLTNLPTQNRPLTEEGTILGTFQYMAPEQLEGREADARTDVFAFGAVLYEMTTGRRAFRGSSKASLIAAIISGSPEPMSVVQPLTPPALARVVQVCLAKDPDERWQSAHDIAEELRWIAEAGSQAGVASVVMSRRRNRERLWSAVAAVTSIAAIASGVMLWKARSGSPPSLHASIVPPPGVMLQTLGPFTASLTLSPDGKYLTFSAQTVSAQTGERKSNLWLNGLESGETRPIPGTEGGFGPFWSPDSQSLAFFANGKLKRVDISGGPAVTIAAAPDGRGGSWNGDGVILFEPYWRDPIYRVSANGGVATPVTKVDEAAGETTHRWPLFLPDGKHFLYLAGNHRETESALNAVYVATLGSRGRRLLLRARSNLVLCGNELLFVRDQYLLAQRLNLKDATLVGEPVRIAENVTEDAGFFRAAFAASDDGTLAYVASGSELQVPLLSFDRAGHASEVAPSAPVFGPVSGLRTSPDGKRLAVSIGATPDIWIYDLVRGSRTRFTTDPMDDYRPVWSPDGKQIVFSSDRNIGESLFIKDVDGFARERPLQAMKDHFMIADDWSPDGRFVAATVEDSKNPGATDIWIVPMAGGQKPYPFIATEFEEDYPLFSPDGKWLAYLSNESGKAELYVVPFPGKGERHQLSNGGVRLGRTPNVTWPAKGHEILYVTRDLTVMSVAVTNGQFGNPQPLYKLPAPSTAIDSFDGQHLLAAINEQKESPPITLITHAIHF
jgi:eukaryotic-like serine/threonine-protein kinase